MTHSTRAYGNAYRSHPEGHRCDCGQPAARWFMCAWCCESCIKMLKLHFAHDKKWVRVARQAKATHEYSARQLEGV